MFHGKRRTLEIRTGPRPGQGFRHCMSFATQISCIPDCFYYVLGYANFEIAIVKFKESGIKYLKEFVNEHFNPLYSCVITTIDFRSFPTRLFYEKVNKWIGPVTKLNRISFTLTCIVISGLYGLIISHIFDHYTNFGSLQL